MPFAEHARAVDDAARFVKAIAPFSATAALSVPEAYKVQALSLRLRLDRGEKPVGARIGLTSRAEKIQMGGADPIWAWLTDAMLIEDGGLIDLACFIRPRVAPGIAFVLKRPLEGRVSLAEAMGAVETVAPAMAIIDSRYDAPPPCLSDMIADNAGSAGFVLGPWNRPDTDLRDLGMVVLSAGRPVQIGSAAAILGHPARALMAASRLGAQFGSRLEAGSILLAGAPAAAEVLRPPLHLRVDVETLGSAGLSTAPPA